MCACRCLLCGEGGGEQTVEGGEQTAFPETKHVILRVYNGPSTLVSTSPSGPPKANAVGVILPLFFKRGSWGTESEPLK